MSPLRFLLHSNCTCMPTIVSVKITTKIFNFKIFPMNFPYFISNMLYENFCFVRKCIDFIFNYVVILFVCLSFCLSFFQKYLQFYQLSYEILNYIIHMSDSNLQFYKKISPHPFSIIF